MTQFSKLRSVFASDLPKGVIIFQIARLLLVITLLAVSCVMGCSDQVAMPPVPAPAVSTPATGNLSATSTASAPEPGRVYHVSYSIVPPEGWTYKPGKHASFIGFNENLVVVVESDPSPTALAHLEKSLPAMRKGRIDFKEVGRSELQIDGQPAVALICAYGPENQRVKVVLYAVSQGDQHVALIFTTPEEMFDRLQEKFEKCALSFRFSRPNDPAPTQTVTPVKPPPSNAALDNFGPFLTWHVPDGKNVSTRVVNDLKFSPDGSIIASATDAEDVIVWSTATTGKSIHSFTGHTKSVNAVEYSPDGKLLISGSDDSTILAWDLSTGQLKYKLERKGEPVSDLALSPDGRQLASCSKISGKVHLWDAIEGKPVREFGHESEIVAFDREGKTLAITKSTSEPFGTNIELWDTATGKLTQTLTGHTNSVQGIVFTSDNQFLMSCAIEGIIRWDLKSGKQAQKLPSQGGERIALSPNGRVLAFIESGKVQFLDMANGPGIQIGEYPASCLAFSPDGKRFALGHFHRDIRIWDLSTVLPAATTPAKTP